MYLKELDIQGFKSFPDKAKLQFNEGITAVVGPNGSGKSNISDAVRWVVGEAKVKNLRGDKMEDVIFAGTAQRKPVGFAEVTLTLDNQDKKMPLDYSEITVKRTVFRSGESRYTINGTACRLKDIHELFMDTGIGRDGYSIIGQGKIDAILSTKSEDRRQLFEEAAGIAKYRSRREEALGKLERERENLVRLDDILGEIKLKLDPLKGQSDDAKQYLSLREKLKKAESDYFCIQDIKLEKEIAEISNNHETAQNDISLCEEEIKKAEERKEKISSEIEKLNAEMLSLQSMADKLKDEEQNGVNTLAVINEQIKQLCRDIERTKAEQDKNAEKTAAILNEKSINNTKLYSSQIRLKALKTEVDSANEKYMGFMADIDNRQKKLDDYKSEMIEKIRLTTTVKTDINECELLIKQSENRLKELDERHGVSKSRLESAKVHANTIKLKLEQKNNEIKEISEKTESFKSELEKIEKELYAENEALKKNTSQLNESFSRHKILSEMKNDFEGFFKSVKAVLKEGKRGSLKGIECAVGEAIKTEKEYENAIETALGATVQNIITDNEENAKNAIYFLKKNNLGRATFMPVSVIEGKAISQGRNEILAVKGVCDTADRLVTFDKRYEGIVSFLLGRTIIAQDMESALKAAAVCARKYRIVTLLGDIINPGGTMTGGSTVSKSSSIFGRNREIDELEEKCGRLEKIIEDQKKRISDASERLSSLKEHDSQNVVLMHKYTLEKDALNSELERTNKDIQNENTAVVNGADEKELLLKEQFENSGKLKELKEKLEAAEKNIQSENSDMEKFDELLSEGKNKKEALLENLRKLQIEETALKKEEESVVENITRLDKEMNECKRTSNEKSRDIAKFKESVSKKEEEAESCEKSVAKIRSEAEGLLKNKNGLSVKIDEENRQSAYCEKEIRQRLETLAELKNEIYRLETKLEGIKTERKRSIENLWDEYEITPVFARKNFDDSCSHDRLTGEIKKLKGDIKSLGYINVKAIEEYKEQLERYEFMSRQKEDIQKAEADLIKVTDDLEELIKKQFSEQFEVISDNFNTVFCEMFGGGRAYLKLTDTNVLESGIEIIAQPPGKNMQNMMLLSGGERALTAIAILFAILKMKPSPFCILDEIEAALDDSNVKRFADYLKTFSKETQFIVITHRKGTMEAADVLYGVTMQEKGVSKVLSVKLDDFDSQEA